MTNSLKTFLKKVLDLIIKISNKWSGQLILVALPILIIFIFIPLTGQVIVQGDVLNYLYPTLYSYSLALQNGLNILWDSDTLSGFATFVSCGEFFSPFNLVFFRFLDFLTAAHWLVALNLILAGFFTLCLLKELALSNLAALVGGLAYAISVQTVDLPLTNAYPLLPLIFWLLLISFKKNRWWPILLGGLVIGLAWLSAHYNWLAIVLSGGFIFSLGLSWIYHQKGWSNYLKMPLRYLVMVLLGSIIGLVQLLPLSVYTRLSSRLGGLSYYQAIEGSINWPDFVNFILPNFNLPFFSQVSQLYLGIIPLIFLISAIFIKSRQARFFSLLFGFCLILAIKYSPLFWLLQKIPVFEYFRVPGRWMFLGLFAGSILAGFGAENFLSKSNENLKKKILIIFKWLLIVIASLSLFLTTLFYFFGSKILDLLKGYFDLKIYPRTTGLPVEHYHKVIDHLFNQTNNLFNFLNPKFILPFIILVVSYLVIRYFYSHKNYLKYFLASAVLVSGLNFIIVFPFNFSTIGKWVFDYQPQIAQFISENPGRVFSFLPGFTEYQKLTVPYQSDQEQIFIFQAELLTPKFNNFYQIASANGFDSLMPKRYSEVIALIGSDRAVVGEKLSNLEISLEDKIKLFQKRQNLLDMLGIRYVISAYDLENEGLTKVFSSQVTQYQIPLYLYENQDFLPLVYLAKEVEYLSQNEESNFKVITDNKNDFNQVTFVECSACQDVQNQPGEIKIEESKNGYLKLIVQAAADSWLIFIQSNLPGWRATIDEQETEIYPANYLFQAILIPAGEHQVIFDYHYLDILGH